MSEPSVLTERGAINPRRVVCYSSHSRFTLKGLSKNMAGRAVILAESDEITSVKLDFSSFLEVNEVIEDATITGPATLLNYSYQSLIFTCAGATECDALITVSAKFTTGERFTDRFHFRTPARPNEQRVTSGIQPRGAF